MADKALETYLAERDRLIGVACRIVECRAVAEDLVQDSWLRWSAKSYSPEDALPILRRIVSNLALDWTRSRRTERRVLQALPEDEATASCSERLVIFRQELARVVRALNRLPPRTVRAFRMRFVDGMAYAEIARRLGLSVSRAHALAEDALVEITIALNR